MVPLIWLIAGLVLLGGELLAGEFVLLMLGGGALVAAGGAALGLGWAGSGLLFAVASVLLLLGVRPALKRRTQRSIQGYQQHHERIVGGQAVVSRRVDGDGGRVRIGPEEWSARSLDEQVIEPGEQVMVIRVEGATVLVLGNEKGET
jgi:membrane protein implicated in regulation of membrane protease activity